MNNLEIAVSAIKEMYDLWQVDADRAQWVGDASATCILRDGYGFDWWPGDFKVSVRVFGPHPERDRVVYRLSVTTDFLCDVDVTTSEFEKRLMNLNRFAPTFAICTYPTIISQLTEKYGVPLDLKSSKVWLASTAYLHDGIKGWLPRFFSGLTVLQPIEAQFRVDPAKALLGGRPDHSNPPECNSETSLGDILGRTFHLADA
jgi:hypothetical protein